jgi:hypothetical protein
MTPFVMITSSGSFSFQEYTVLARVRSYAAEAVVGRGAPRARVQGDRLMIPSAINVRVFIDEPTLAGAYATAFQVLMAANTASSITTYEGSTVVNGVLGALFDIEQPHLFLTLSFAPVTS